MADRIGVISKGEIILVEDKVELMHKLGKQAADAAAAAHAGSRSPPRSPGYGLELSRRRQRARLHLRRPRRPAPASPRCSKTLDAAGIGFKDLHTTQSSLEDIFVSLVREER